MGGNRYSMWAAAMVALFVFGLSHCTTEPSHNTDSPYLNHSDSAEYVGMDVCGSCHLDKQQTFVHTGMGMSFDHASQSKSAGKFDGHALIYDSVLNFYYQPFWRDTSLYLKEFRLNGTDTAYQRTEKIDYIIGSGQHTNSHLIRKGDYIVQAPFTVYTQSGKLDLPPGFENGNNSRFKRIIDQECMSCHNAMPVMNEGLRSFKSIGTGIDCERCHGPGSLHVNFRSAGKSPEGDIDYTIVNPGKLNWSRQIDVCQRCHLQGNNVLKPGKTFADFIPGMNLSDVFEIYLPQFADGSGQFNMANHADRFQSSKCFENTNADHKYTSFTCVTCHNPHVSVKTLEANHFNKTCTGCHTTNRCKLPIETRKAKNENDCVTCHMPVSGSEDIPHVTVHDHKIAVYTESERESRKSGVANDAEVIGLYAVNNPKPEPEMLIRAYLTYYEKFSALSVYQEKASELLREYPNQALQIHLHFQRREWKAIIELAESGTLELDGDGCYRVAKAYHQTGNFKAAVQWFDLAVLKSPDRFEYKSEQSATYIKLKNYLKAKESARSALHQYNDYVPALNNYGYSCILLREFNQAQAKLLKARALDPDHLNTLENLALLYQQTGKQSELRTILEAILLIDQNHSQAKSMLSTLN